MLSGMIDMIDVAMGTCVRVCNVIVGAIDIDAM